MEAILVSACLRGVPCRFDGRHKASSAVEEAVTGREVVSFCPEVAGGLTTPRRPAELVGGDGHDVLDGTARVVEDTGRDVTAEFVDGARRALAAARHAGCAEALLMPRSPSCGRGVVYDGSFAGELVTGDGVTAALLERNGIAVRPAPGV
ncbi:2-thiouracil desulfurase family protein [Streptomyces sp. YIM S03343]